MHTEQKKPGPYKKEYVPHLIHTSAQTCLRSSFPHLLIAMMHKVSCSQERLWRPNVGEPVFWNHLRLLLRRGCLQIRRRGRYEMYILLDCTAEGVGKELLKQQTKRGIATERERFPSTHLLLLL